MAEGAGMCGTGAVPLRQTNKTKNNVCFSLLLFDGSYFLLLFTASPTKVTMHISLLLFFDVSL